MSKNDKSAKTASRAGDRTAADVIQIQASRPTLVVTLVALGLLFLGAAFAGFSLGARTRPSNANGSTAKYYPVQNAPFRNAGTETFHANPGPWGDLECQRTFIEIPDEYLSTKLHEADIPRWFFKGYSSETLTKLFQQASLSHPESQDLLNTKNWEVSTAGIYVKPSQSTVLSLSPESRKAIYSVLAQFEQNPAQEQAFHWPADAADAALDGADISDQTRSLVKKLSYRFGKLVMFADLSTVLRSLPNEAEKRRLEKALSRRPTMLVRLNVNPQSDIESLADYWARAGFGKDIRPILEAAAKISQGTKLSILNLLPPWPTARLYSFPFPTLGAQYDCFWTAFNFFKESPEAPVNDGSYWKRKLDTEYYPVSSDMRYGDLVMLVTPNGTIIHACTFIADNIVYTKNGASATVPWILMTIPDLIEAYASELPEGQSLRVQCYRSKNV